MPSTAADRERVRNSPESVALALRYNHGLRVRRTGLRTWEADSRTRSRLTNHRLTVALDGEVLCSCEAGMNNLECWAATLVREELTMTTETALVPIEMTAPKTLVPSHAELVSIKEVAALAMAGAISLPEGVRTPEQAAALMLYGWELGIPPMTALQKLWLVKGRVTPSAEIMAGLVMRRERDIRFIIEVTTDQECRLRIQRPSRHISETYTVTWAEITKAGLDNATNKQYPRDRLRYHCMKRLLRIYAPDLINNLDGPRLTDAPAVSWDDDVLYNDVDEDAVGEPAYTNVDRETGEILEAPSAPPTGPERVSVIDYEQQATLRDWYENIITNAARKEALTDVGAHVPYARKDDGGIRWAEIKVEDFDGVVTILRAIAERRPGAAQQGTLGTEKR